MVLSEAVTQMQAVLRELEEIDDRPSDATGARLASRLDTLIEEHPEAFAEALATFSPRLAEPSPQSAPPPELRKTWRSYLSFQKVEPLQVWRPKSPHDLVELLGAARQNGCRVKAVGSGHSFSDIATTPDFLVETHTLDRVLPLDKSCLKQPEKPRIEVESGITVKVLNQKLDELGLALENLGSFDGQTICGAISTGTHGTGVGLGPLAASVESLTVVAANGEVYRVEPRDGITDPAKFRQPGVQLRQDDDWFQSIVVGMGCMGLVYSLILRVQPAYWLEQKRTLTSWSALFPAQWDPKLGIHVT